jgi:NTE family protein
MAALLCACAGMQPNIGIPKTMPKPLKLAKQPRVALVLGAGGARGFAHAGAVKILQDAGIPIDLIVGTSVGSFYGALLADSGDATIAGQIMLSTSFWNLADIANVPSLSGLMQGYHYQKFLLHHMQARWFNQLKIPLVVVATDLKTGKECVISSGPIAPAAEASSAIPGAVRPAYLYGHILVDGGMLDPIPVNIAKRYHPKVIIAINISQQLSTYVPYTAVGVYDRAYDISWRQLSRLSAKDADIIIRPQVGAIGTFEVEKKYQLFYEGEVAAYHALPAIKKILREKHIKLLKSNSEPPALAGGKYAHLSPS